MEIATIFQDGQSQAVRLPDDFRFDSQKVFIEKRGNAVVLFPYHAPWNSLFESLDEFTDDYMEDRNQPQEQIRENLFK